jgi:hypothetical protein
VSTGLKKKKTRFTFRSFVRLLIFSVIIFLIISFLSEQKKNFSQEIDSTLSLDEKQTNSILGKTTEISNNIYNSIPPKSREQLENLNQTPVGIFLQEKINFIKEQSQDFPQKQIKEIQKAIIKNIYENTIKNIDSQ